jgi:hypothetical protein
VTSNVGRGGRRYLPYVFTEHGVVMAASVLSSPRAVEVSMFVVRAFVKLRHLVLVHTELAGKLDQGRKNLQPVGHAALAASASSRLRVGDGMSERHGASRR